MPTGALEVNIFSYVESAAGGDTSLLDGSTPSRIERDIEVFRVGTFTDSRGRTKTWTVDLLDLAVQNFRTLRDRNIIPHVPVRRDHTISIKDVGGYLADIRRVGDRLKVDIEFTDDDMRTKYKNRTYRNRSLEIGQYVTNDGEMYDPVVLGLAFVDLPAVEGLYHLSTGENMLTSTDTPPAPAPTPTPTPSPTPTPTPSPTPPTPSASGEPTTPTPPPTPTPAPAPQPTPTPEPPSEHRQPVQTFRLSNGEITSDYGRVQAELETLAGFQRDTIAAHRREFVDGLATNRVIGNPQREAFQELVKTMSDEQFSAFQKSYEGAVPAALFGKVPTDGGGDGQPSNPRQDRIDVLEAIVHNHRTLGKDDEFIHKTATWRELQEIKAKG